MCAESIFDVHWLMTFFYHQTILMNDNNLYHHNDFLKTRLECLYIRHIYYNYIIYHLSIIPSLTFLSGKMWIILSLNSWFLIILQTLLMVIGVCLRITTDAPFVALLTLHFLSCLAQPVCCFDNQYSCLSEMYVGTILEPKNMYF